MNSTFSRAIVAIMLALPGPFLSNRAKGDTPLTKQLIASGMSQPLCMACPPGDPTRIFIVEKAGKIRLIKNGVLQATPYLDIDARVRNDTLEWGMLGMTFHPDYLENGYFYVNYNEQTGGDTVISRFRVTENPDIADPNSEQVILYLDQPSPNHRGGWLAFGPDGYLYDSQGDGGSQNDPSNRAQNINLLQGKILRLDVDGPDGIPGTADDDGFPGDSTRHYRIPPTNPYVGISGADEIWALGLRNPWRCSFDRETWDIWIGDVGQFAREEISMLPFGSVPPLNFGWRCMEAELCTGMTGCTCNAPTLTPKVYSYSSTVGKSVTGGYVYRGCNIPELRGTYFFAEWQFNHVWSFRNVGGVVTSFVERTAELAAPAQIAAFGEDLDGELYMIGLGGSLYKIVPVGGGGGGGSGGILTIALDEQLPAIVPACTSFTFDVKIAACGETVTAGSERLYYRFDNGAFQSSVLVSQGDGIYIATLPPAPCGSTPQFYLSVEGSTGAPVTDPPSAPAAVHSVAVGIPTPSLVYSQSFETGMPVGWTADGLWNVSSACAMEPVCEGGAWAYYGQAGTCNYDVGANSGSLTAAALALPVSSSITLTYCSAFEREAFGTSDWPTLRVNSTVVDSPALGGLGSSPWVQRCVNLTAYSGQIVTLEWHFQTVDGDGNAFRGWQIDDVRITAVQPLCDAPPSIVKGDMSANGLADGGDIQLFIDAALIQSTLPIHVCPGDFTGDGMVTTADAAGFAGLLIGG